MQIDKPVTAAHTSAMNEKWFLRLVLLVTVLSTLAACSREKQPSVSPAGSWQGTLTVMKFPSPTQLFTAKITATNQAKTEYNGIFTIGDTSQNVTGRFAGRDSEGEHFIFRALSSELQVTENITWSGFITDDTYQGGMFQTLPVDTEAPLQIAEFVLERLP